jgi:hypothetical protein
MAVKELVDKYQSGKGTIIGWQETTQRILEADSYENWRSDPDVPQYGDPHPINSNLIVVKIDYEGCGPLDSTVEGIFKYKSAKLVITYSSNADAEVPLSRGEVSSELLMVGGFGSFQVSGNIIDKPRAVTIGIDNFTITRISATLPKSTIAGMRNKVNNASWNPDGLYSYPAETVLFRGAPYDPYRAPDGTIMWRITYQFSVKDVGWNSGFDGGTGLWDIALPRLYTPASFVGFPPA